MMKTIIGALVVVGLAVGFEPAWAANVRQVTCPDEDLRLCRTMLPDVRDGQIVHVVATLPATCFPTVTLHRVADSSDWNADAAPGTYATVAGVTPGQISFAVVNDSGTRRDMHLDFLWACYGE